MYIKLTRMSGFKPGLWCVDCKYCFLILKSATECVHKRWVLVQVRRFEEYMYGNSERFAEKAEVNA